MLELTNKQRVRGKQGGREDMRRYGKREGRGQRANSGTAASRMAAN